MKNRWIIFFSGIITVKISGKGLERLLNNLIRNGLFIWQVRRQGVESITFKMKLSDVGKFRKYVRGSGCKVTFYKREGFPFLLIRLLKNSGFLIGSILFIFVILLLSNMIWGIQVKGADPATEYKIYKELDKMGVKVGKLQLFVDNVESIQRQLTNNVEEITWVGVELQGTTYHLQVVEKNEPKQPEYLSPQNLVAKKKAVIVDMFVEDGQAVVNIHDSVEEGQLLVSGLIGKEGQTVQVPAKGEIWGETWYRSDVELPLKTTFQVFNGNEKRKYYLQIANFKIPIWGFGKIEYKEYETEATEKTIQFLKWELPLSYIHETHREKEVETRIYSKEEAFQVAKEMAKLDIKNRLSEEAKIKGEKILHQSIDNGKVSIAIHFQIIENIAEGQPIIQGESE
ncbi:sporulation protein YqfD [Niallia endozanthoxylica]|uniref:Sporulation protein YqfD n=1 Tax=Niallia endozanthoxylica TaxID=2036016 RepID=A0A5J5HW15_9BACI|nr:sporulation protein YqfD [Niallia endozanthoxylica]KAA9026351.1 sporulation protein YqfD [Niallia endozanthoxylica]